MIQLVNGSRLHMHGSRLGMQPVLSSNSTYSRCTAIQSNTAGMQSGLVVGQLHKELRKGFSTP